MNAPPVRGLILAGGRSRRMGRDKAALDWGGENALERAARVLGEAGIAAHLALRTEQSIPAGWPADRVVRDDPTAGGPLAGILAAFEAEPGSAWLVVGCDQPLLEAPVLGALLAGRDPSVDATCFLDTDGKLPDPLCALYEPTFAEAARPWVASGKGCPRKVLLNARIVVLPCPGQSLRDADTPRERRDLDRISRSGSPALRKVTVEYWASLRDRAGRATETLETAAADLAGLWDELAVARGLPESRAGIRPALGDEFAAWEAPIADGDVVAFLPPASGG